MAITADNVTLLPDAGPLITLAYADALDLLLKPGWQVAIVDMVLHEVTRNVTPTSKKIADWVQQSEVQITPTQTFAQHSSINSKKSKKAHLGEQAIQETLNKFALLPTVKAAVLLFEDHAIASNTFFIPDSCQKISTRAFLLFLEQKGWIESATDIERRAVHAGRQFSQLRFPPK
jgi:hypothetical protein